MRATTVLALTALNAALVVNCSKFAVSGSETSGILTDAQLASPVVEPDGDLTLSLRLRARPPWPKCKGIPGFRPHILS
jgi:hypothetical protein